MSREELLASINRAASCPSFRQDVEEEQVTDDPVSCWNCYFRRWVSDRSFRCMAEGTGHAG